MQGQVEPLLALDRLEATQVDRGGARRVVLLVGLGEGVGVAPAEHGAGLLAVLGEDRGQEVVAPRARRVGEAALEVVGVERAQLAGDGRVGLAARQVHHEVHPRGGRLVDAHRELDRLPAQALEEDLAEPLAHRGVVAVARQVDQHRDVAAVGVGADDRAHRTPLARQHRRLGHRRELGDVGVEELVARVGLEGVHQGPAGVGARVEAAAAQHLAGLLAQQRDAGQRLGVRRRGEQPQEALLADDLAALVERLDPDVVEVGRAVHGGAGVGLGQHQQGLLAGLDLDRVGQPREGGAVGLVGAQDAQPGAGHRAQHVLVDALDLGELAAMQQQAPFS